MLSVTKILKYSDFFKNVKESVLLDLAFCCRQIQVPAGTIIINQDEDNDYDFYIISKGQVEIIHRYSDYLGRISEISFIALERSVIGEISAVKRCKRTATVRCKTDVEGVCIDGTKFMNYMDEHPETGFIIMRSLVNVLSTRLTETTSQLSDRLAII